MKLKTSLSVVSFKKKAEEVWGLKEWEGITDPDKDLLFFGLYNDRDWALFDSFQGKKSVFWAGTDILQVLSDYERKRMLRNHPDTKHYCENTLEAEELNSIGLAAKIVPSFLDNVNNYPASYKPSKNPHVFLCGHDEREEEYGIGLVKRIAPRLKDTTFHIYGINTESSYFTTSGITQDKLAEIDTECPNIWYHGKVPEGQFNNEIMNYQCGLRPNEHDGFSEVLSKSVLLGQYPISRIIYPHIWSYQTEDELVALIDKLKYTSKPNLDARSYYLKEINNFPWCKREYVK